MTPKHPEVEVRLGNLKGPEGNAYIILGKIRKELKLFGISEDEIRKFLDEATSGDYEDLLKVCKRWVTCK